jgi:hypothetical protein
MVLKGVEQNLELPRRVARIADTLTNLREFL